MLKHEDFSGQPRLSFDVNSINPVVINSKNFPYVRISNCVLINKSKEDNERITVKGNVFVIDLLEQNYYHFIETLSHFFLLKTIIPDLHLIIIERNPYNHTPIKNFTKGFIEIFDKNLYTFIKRDQFSSIMFENIFYINTTRMQLLNEIAMFGDNDEQEKSIIKNTIESSQQEVHNNIFYNGLLELRKYLYPLNIEQKLEYKIFIPTTSINNKHREYKEFLDAIDSGIDQDSEEFKTIKNKINTFSVGTIDQMRHFVDSRYISEEDEIKIFDYFISKGYKIVNTESMSIKDQIKLYRSCSHIATITGSSCLASAFCDDNTNFIIIDNNHKYEHKHDEYAKFLLKNVISVFEREDSFSVYSIDEVLEYIENNYKDKI